MEPVVCGPYHTEHERDNAVKQIRRKQQEDDGLFWADIDEAGTLPVGTYMAGFFWQQPREDVNLQRGSEDSIQRTHSPHQVAFSPTSRNLFRFGARDHNSILDKIALQNPARES